MQTLLAKREPDGCQFVQADSENARPSDGLNDTTSSNVSCPTRGTPEVRSGGSSPAPGPPPPVAGLGPEASPSRREVIDHRLCDENTPAFSPTETLRVQFRVLADHKARRNPHTAVDDHVP